MRVAHVVTYDSPDGAFGGPLTVAKAHAKALAGLGHDIVLYAAAPVDAEVAAYEDGFQVRRFPARWLSRVLGFAGMHSPGLRRAIGRDVHSFDVVHVHVARDLVTLPAARRVLHARVPYVLQPHGMIDRSSRALSRPVDLLLTRPVLRGASAVLALTELEASELAHVEATAVIDRVVNGVELPDELPEYGGRAPVVLFLARLHERKRPLAFVEIAARLAATHPHVRFQIAGPDEGEEATVREAIRTRGLDSRVQVLGAVGPDRVAEVMRAASVYVLPSVNEVFPMTLLEALQAGTPTVVTESLGVAPLCMSYGAALVEDADPAALAGAVATVLDRPGVADALRVGGLRMLRERVDIKSVAAELVGVYKRAIGACGEL